MPHLTETGIAFLEKFLRFECALKKTGFCTSNTRNDVVIRWDDFMGIPEIQALYPSLRDDPEARVLFDDPPKKRILVDSVLSWSDRPATPSDMHELGVMLRRVRNNFFHGDKANIGSERNNELLRASLVVLQKLLDAHYGLRIAFQNE